MSFSGIKTLDCVKLYLNLHKGQNRDKYDLTNSSANNCSVCSVALSHRIPLLFPLTTPGFSYLQISISIKQQTTEN